MAEGQELLLRKDLERVVDRLHQERTHVAPYQEDYRRLLDNHGKMIRAALVILFARAGTGAEGRLDDTVITGAAAIEMLHLATLVHDDVLDNASIRRNKPTVHTIRGNKTAIYLGDLILSRYMEIMASIAPDTDFIREQAGTVCEIVGGELYQESDRHHTHITVDDYNRAISGKTAALFRLSCLTGIRLDGQPTDPALERTARDFGSNLGMAFQIIDDINDFDLDRDTGKPKLEDIRDGIYTLPVLLGFQEDENFRALVQQDDSDQVVDYFRAHPQLMESSRQIAKDYLLHAADSLVESPMDRSLRELLQRITAKLIAQV